MHYDQLIKVRRGYLDPKIEVLQLPNVKPLVQILSPKPKPNYILQ